MGWRTRRAGGAGGDCSSHLCFHTAALAQPSRGADRESTQGRKLPGLFLHDGSPVPGCPQPPCRSLITETGGTWGKASNPVLARWGRHAPRPGPCPLSSADQGRLPFSSLSKVKQPGQPAPEPVSLGILGRNRLWVLRHETGRGPGCMSPASPSKPRGLQPHLGRQSYLVPPTSQKQPLRVCAQPTLRTARGNPRTARASKPAQNPEQTKGQAWNETSEPAKFKWARLGVFAEFSCPVLHHKQRTAASYLRVSADPWLDSASSPSTASQGLRAPSLSLSGQAVPGKAPPACLEFPAGCHLPLSFLDFSAGAALAPRVLSAPHPWPQPSVGFQHLPPNAWAAGPPVGPRGAWRSHCWGVLAQLTQSSAP